MRYGERYSKIDATKKIQLSSFENLSLWDTYNKGCHALPRGLTFNIPLIVLTGLIRPLSFKRMGLVRKRLLLRRRLRLRLLRRTRRRLLRRLRLLRRRLIINLRRRRHPTRDKRKKRPLTPEEKCEENRNVLTAG